MLYRETGQFKTSYAADEALFPIPLDRFGHGALILLLAALPIPLLGSDFFITTVMIPFLVFSLATIGLNLLTGYAGQISLGTGGFMGVGAYACYKLATVLPEANILVLMLVSGPVLGGDRRPVRAAVAADQGLLPGVATLAAQFFLDWCFNRIAWLYNYNASGAIQVPTRAISRRRADRPDRDAARALLRVAGHRRAARLARLEPRARPDRPRWMMVRDMDIAAELMGVRLLRTKLLAFAVSSFYCGVAGALMVFLWLGAAEASSFSINVSFQVLFMVIIGGAGSLLGSFLGAAFIWVLPIVIRAVPRDAGHSGRRRDASSISASCSSAP